jgi:transposase-like protein
MDECAHSFWGVSFMAALTDKMREALAQAAKAHGVPAHLLVSWDKRPQITSARQHWFYSLAMNLGYSYSEIAMRTGYHHTSVMYGVRMRAQRLHGTSARARRQEIETAYRAAQEALAA